MSSDRIHNEHCRPQSIGSKKITTPFFEQWLKECCTIPHFLYKKTSFTDQFVNCAFLFSAFWHAISETSVGHDMAHIFSVGCRILSRAAEFVLGRGIFKFLRNIINDG